MTLGELGKVAKTDIRVLSPRDDRVICFNFYAKKHESIADREVSAIWPEIKTSVNGYRTHATTVICVYLKGVGK